MIINRADALGPTGEVDLGRLGSPVPRGGDYGEGEPSEAPLKLRR